MKINAGAWRAMAIFAKNRYKLLNKGKLAARIYLNGHKIWGNNYISTSYLSQPLMINSIQSP